MKQIIKTTALLIALLLPVISTAHDFEVDGIYYRIKNDNKCSVTYRGTSFTQYSNEYFGDVVIPPIVVYNGITYSVVSIEQVAFCECNELTGITIPNSVISIEHAAFEGCTGLTSMTLPNTITTIGECAFYGCSGLTSVTIPDAIKFINRSVFQNCSGLSSINIPNSVTTIGQNAFRNCTGLTSMTLPNTITTIGEGAFYGCSGLTSINIPNSVTAIGHNAFEDCTELANITIPNTVTAIGEDAFNNTLWFNRQPDGLVYAGFLAYKYKGVMPINTDITIIDGTIGVGEGVFKNCIGLSGITIPNSVTFIGNSAFSGCSSLASVTIPSSVNSIGSYAFSGCSSLASVTIPSSVNSIGSYAFSGCSGLKDVYSFISEPSSINMGGSVFSLSYYATYSNRMLHVPVGSVEAYQANVLWEPYFDAIADMDCYVLNFKKDGLLYSTTSDTTVKVSGQSFWNKAGESEYDYYYYLSFLDIEIPSQVSYNYKDYMVTEIGDSAFYCEGFNSFEHDIDIDYNIMIPETITSIGYKAFAGSFGMVNVFCEAQTPPVMNDIVDEYHGIFNLFVSADAYMLYQELNNQNHYYDTVYITDGKRSGPPQYSVEYLEQPIGYGPYGCAVKIFPDENSVVYLRHIYNGTGLYDHIYIGAWTKCENIDSLYYYYETECDGGARPDGWAIEFFAIKEGHSPSAIMSCGLLGTSGEKGRDGIDYKRWEYFDFMDKGICYNVDDNCASVTYQGYGGPCVGEKVSVDRNESITGTNKPKDSVKTDHYEDEYDYVYEFVYYSGDVVIPNMAIYRNYDEDTYTAYPVTSINWRAFMDCDGLQSVTLPESIASVQEESFINCPNLSFIKCLGTTPASASESSFDDGVYQNTLLYVPCSAIGAYRQAEGWCNFQNIVGVNDDNYLSMSDVEAFRGDTIVIPVAMFNSSSIISFQTDIFLPDGIELLQEDGEYIIDPSDRMTRTHSIVSNDVSNGAVRVLCYSSNYKPFTGESGDDLFYLTVKVADDAEGDYAIQLKNTLLTTSDFEELVAPDVSGTVHVKSYMPGDANGSGTVTVTDVVVASQYVLEMNPHPFIFEAADVNFDGTITVTDVSRIAWIVLNPTMTAPMRASALLNNGDRMSGESMIILPGETRKVSIVLDNEMDYTAFQLDLNLPEGLSASNFAVTDRAGNHTFDVSMLADGNTRALCYSPTLKGLSGHEGALLTFDVTATGLVQGDITVDGIELVTTGCQTVKLDAFAIGVNNESSISEVSKVKTVARVDYYNLAGQKIDSPASGVTIVITTYSDGTQMISKTFR